MFKPIKNKAFGIAKSRFKIFFIPSFAYMLSLALQFMFGEAFGFGEWNNIFLAKGAIGYLWVVPAFLISTFVLIPITLAVMFRVCITLINGEHKKVDDSIIKFLSLTNIKQIILINLVPQFIGMIRSLYSVKGLVATYIPYLANEDTYQIVKLVILAIYIYVTYKFFICNYYFAKTETPAKETVLYSFEIMKKFRIFIKEELLKLSFILWEFFALMLYWIFKILSINVESHGASVAPAVLLAQEVPQLDVLYIFRCGLGFFIYPFMLLSFSLFIEELIKEKEQSREVLWKDN
ncbi:MAG: hypothetical protein IJZ75_05905 [Clostridia bacterium]|nr:hypothetical protein [Clostridia bacterium]